MRLVSLERFGVGLVGYRCSFESQYVGGLQSVSSDGGLLAVHDNCVLSVRAITLCGLLYGGSKARRMASSRRNT